MQTSVLADPKEYWMMNKFQKLSTPEFMSPTQNLYEINFTFQHTQLLSPKPNLNNSLKWRSLMFCMHWLQSVLQPSLCAKDLCTKRKNILVLTSWLADRRCNFQIRWKGNTSVAFSVSVWIFTMSPSGLGITRWLQQSVCEANIHITGQPKLIGGTSDSCA